MYTGKFLPLRCLAVLIAMQKLAFGMPLTITEIPNNPKQDEAQIDTFITAGLMLEHVPNSFVYTDEYVLSFPLPELPELPEPTSAACDIKSPFCELYKDISIINKDTLEILDSASHIFSEAGVSERAIAYETEELTPEEENDVDVQNAGAEWYKKAKQSLFYRRSGSHGTLTKEQLEILYTNITEDARREKRNVLAVAKPLLFKAARSFFFGKGNLLASLTNQRSLLPKIFKPFTEVAEFVSDLGETILSNGAISSVVKDIFDITMRRISPNTEEGRLKHNEEFKLTLQAIAQNSLTSQHLTNLHILHSAMLSCRDGLLPLGLLPPKVLRHRLRQLESSLSSDLSLVFSSAEIPYYYNLRLATCKYDDEGGIVGVRTLLQSSQSKHQLFQLKSFGFAYHDSTCDMGIESGLLVRDTFNGAIFPVTQLDEDSCKKDETTLCKLPEEANADVPRNYCLMTALGGGNSKEIADACPLTCRKGKRLSYTQLDDDSIVVVHLPFSGAKVKCDDLEYPVTHNFPIGAIKVTLGCGCSLMYKSRIVAKSQRVICDKQLAAFTINHILPIQMSLINRDWVPLHMGELLDTKFTSNDVVDEAWRPADVEEDPTWVSYQFPIWGLPSNILCFISIVIVGYRQRMAQIQLTALLAVPNIPLVRGGRSDTVMCQLSGDVYWILSLIVLLQVVLVGYFVLKFTCSKYNKLREAYIRNEVRKRIKKGNASIDPDV